MPRPRPCLECSKQTASASKARSAPRNKIVPSPCALAGDARCALRTDPISLLARWLWPPPPPRDPAAALHEYAALMAAARAAPAAAAGGATATGGTDAALAAKDLAPL